MSLHTVRRGLPILLLLAAPGLAGADVPAPVGGLGGKLYYAGGDIQVKVMPASAGYTSELGIYKGSDASQRKLKIATNRQAGTTISITAAQMTSFGFKESDELIFGIFVQNTSTTYFMGDGSRNPDGIAHAKLTIDGAKEATVGFEDLFGGGDRDYDDNVFHFSGGVRGIAAPPPPPNSAPNCALAKPSVTELWPPNHTLLPVTIDGIKDPENDAFTVQILSVFQDEPVKGTGSGHTAPDAEFSGSTLKLRAERDGKGDTRVYNVSFVATDSKGAKCAKTTVSVSVPHHKGAETPPRGPVTFDSTEK